MGGPLSHGHVFPAHAGMSLRELMHEIGEIGFPRPRGDEPFQSGDGFGAFGFSPPTRG